MVELYWNSHVGSLFTMSSDHFAEVPLYIIHESQCLVLFSQPQLCVHVAMFTS